VRLGDADPVGEQAQTAFRAHGGTIATLQAIDYASAEYQQMSNGGNANLIDQLYRDILNRPADTGGRAYWLDQLNYGPVMNVVMGLLHSVEAESHVVRDDMQAFLGRPADTGGLNFFTQALVGGASEEDVLAAILASTEHFKQAAR